MMNRWVLCLILSEDDFEIESKIYSLTCVLFDLYFESQDVLFIRNLFFTLLF